MVLNKGGYVIINKALNNVYELAYNALTSGKPILWYETDTECYYIDTITLSGTDVVLTKGGKTITIEADGDITETSDIQNHLFKHDITIGTINVSFSIYTNIKEQFDVDSLTDYFKNNNPLCITSSSLNKIYSRIHYASMPDNVLQVDDYELQGGLIGKSSTNITTQTITDTVIQLF